jgi:hypothetical protein
MCLHFVDANGQYAERYKYDSRPNIGIKENDTKWDILIKGLGDE